MTSLGTFLALVADATDSYCTSSFRPPLLASSLVHPLEVQASSMIDGLSRDPPDNVV